jgi:2-dehydro-3-deoxyphosphogluconate aldolase/(4S)-4-hydroxy-2-oxoglutarate aldolase
MSDNQSRQSQLAEVLALGPIIPVITIDRLEHAVPLARALVAGGVRLLEITLRTPAGLAGAEAIIRQVPDAVVGIGTVLTPADIRRAEDIGARFALSPGATPALLDAAATAGIPFMPGIATASELMEALARGFGTAKFFPATAAGGLAALKALAGPFPQARFCPTGGITEQNAADWLAQPNVVAVGGSWLTPAAEIAAGQWDAIAARATRSRECLVGIASG